MTENQPEPPKPPSRISPIKLGAAMLVIAVGIAWIASTDAVQTRILQLRGTPDLEQAVRQDPQSPWPAYVLGVRYARKGRLADAVQLFERARQSAPDSGDVRFALGKAYALTGNNAAALTELNKAVELMPGNAQTYRFLGRVQRLLGDTEGGKKSEQRATQLDPKDAEAWYQYGVLYPPGSSNEADGRPFLKKAAELAPTNGIYAFAYGSSLADGSQFSEAVPFLRKAVALLPGDANARFLLGLALHRGGAAGSTDEAITALKQALELDPADFRSHFELANIYTERGDYALAYPELKRAVELNSQRPEVWSALGLAAARTGHKEVAAEAQSHFTALRKDHLEMEKLQHHLAQHPYDTATQMRIADLFVKQADFRSAGIYLSAILEREPENARAAARMNEVRRKMAEKRAAATPAGAPKP